MRRPEVTDADLNALVDLELGADELAPVMIHLLVEPEAAQRVAAYSRQRSILEALRVEMNLRPASPHLSQLEDEIRRLARRQNETRRGSALGGAIAPQAIQ